MCLDVIVLQSQVPNLRVPTVVAQIHFMHIYPIYYKHLCSYIRGYGTTEMNINLNKIVGLFLFCSLYCMFCDVSHFDFDFIGHGTLSQG